MPIPMQTTSTQGAATMAMVQKAQGRALPRKETDGGTPQSFQATLEQAQDRAQETGRLDRQRADRTRAEAQGAMAMAAAALRRP